MTPERATADDPMPPQRVLLLHGLWLRAFTLQRLAERLHAAGFETESLDFGSLVDEPYQTVARLRQRFRDDPRPAAVVGHSLGGMMALHTLSEHPELPVSRVVCLGSPLRGSRIATRLAPTRVAPVILGRSANFLREGLPPWTGAAQVGVLAGTLPVGLGFAFTTMSAPHDGTVCAEETRLEGITDHAVVRTTHTGLLFSREAAQQTVHFLRHGRFAPTQAVPADG